MISNDILTTRRATRAIILQVLYEVDSVKHDPHTILESMVTSGHISPSAEAFAYNLINEMLMNIEELDNTIAKYAPSWPITQMSTIDRNILRTAIYEMELNGETPLKVAINEAVNLAKVFGSDNSPQFINGVLGSIVGEIKI